MPDNITITIDGMEITTQPGKMVLEAAIDAGVYIPYLCYHSGMKPYAACRMCVVSVEGGRGFPASCTLPVQDGMNVRSESHDVTELRRSVMEMLIAEHPSGCLTCHRIDICGPTNICLRHVSVNDRCVTCPKNERCEFKDTVRYLGMELESPLNYTYKQIPLEVKDPFYDRDMNLCITCGRCVRVCEEVRGDDAIVFVERSGKALVGTSFGSSLLESGCEFCGACVDVCPVGALVEKENKWEKARQVMPTICPHCPVGCQVNLELNAEGKMIRVFPEINSPANRGQACFKGKFGLGFINNPQRLSTPLIRRDGQLEPTTWEEALAHMAQRLAEYKGDSFALLTSPNSTNEEHYLAQKFARTVMGTNNVDQSSNTQPELTIGLERALGYGAATNPIWQLEQANCILVFNSNLTEEQNVVGVPIKRSVKNGTKLIVIDAREVELTRYADAWLRPVPGTELLLLGGILKSLLDQSLESSEWLEEWCEEPATLHYVLRSVEIAHIARVTQVSAEAIAQAASYFGGADNAAIVYALDNVPGEVQRDCVNALVDMVLLTGNVGRPGTGIYPMRQGTNEQGAWDVGCVPFRLPGGRPWRDENARKEVETLWECSLPETRGKGLAAVMEAALAKTVKALMLIGDGSHLIDSRSENGLAALNNLDFLVVMDSFLSPAAQLADVVLPRATFAEKDGTYTNLERRVQRIRPAINNDQGKSQPEGWVICQIAQRMGSAGFSYTSPAAVMDELSQITPSYLGITFDRLEQQVVTAFKSDLESPKPTQLLYATKEQRGIQWPLQSETNGGTAILYTEGFPMGKANPITPEFRKEEVSNSSEYPFQYVPGRVLLQRDRETSVVGEKLNRIVREEWVQLNPADAEGLSLTDGDTIEVQTEHGRLRGEARFDKSIPTGVVSVTSLFGQLAVSLQESDEPDPMANVPGLNIAPAKVTRVDP